VRWAVVHPAIGIPAQTRERFRSQPRPSRTTASVPVVVMLVILVIVVMVVMVVAASIARWIYTDVRARPPVAARRER
jgi:hypothetical protein